MDTCWQFPIILQPNNHSPGTFVCPSAKLLRPTSRARLPLPNRSMCRLSSKLLKEGKLATLSCRAEAPASPLLSNSLPDSAELSRR